MAVSTTTRRRLTATPFMRLGTHSAYAVLTWVRTQVKKEPKRLNMERWVTLFRGVDSVQDCQCDGCKTAREKVMAMEGPACGTVACLGGWINIGTRNGNSEYNARGTDALRKLGIDRDTNSMLHTDLSTLFGRTHLRVDDVIDQLDKILDTYATELKALKVEVTPWTDKP